MVYLAADNNLANFGIDSLKQMKAVCGDSANILAEFYAGPRHPTKRYLFDHKTVVGSIEQNIIDKLPAKNAGDPANLTAFIKWATDHYQAEHYFLVIWGHGSGCDDDFPRESKGPSLSDRSFVQRHRLLDYGKGVYPDVSKGVLDDASKGVLDDASKGVLDEASKSVLIKLTGHINVALKDALKEVSLDPCQVDKDHFLLELEVLRALETGTLSAFRDGISKQLNERVLTALEAGIQNAARMGVFDTMQRRIMAALQAGGHDAVDILVQEAIHRGSLDRLFRNVFNAMHTGAKSLLPIASAETKALAFSDHPASYMTNLKLQEALRNGCRTLPGGKHKLDLVGMDACQMNMIEIGFELRDCAQYLVASQEAVPDASWPYDGILRHLMGSSSVLPRDLACATATTYVENYRDYIDQPVALSVLNLQVADEMAGLFKQFTNSMETCFRNAGMKQAILSARKKARSFGQNQFVDVVDFCQCLAEEPESNAAGSAALSLIEELQPFIAYNEFTPGLKGCNGTSFYFPEFDRANAEHQQDLAVLYSKLDFAQQTGWGRFVADVLKQQAKELRTNQMVIDAKKLPAKPSKSRTNHESTVLDERLVAAGGNGNH